MDDREAVQLETARRVGLLEALGTSEPTAAQIRELGIYVQQRGNYRNLAATGHLAAAGVTQSILIRGDAYDDDHTGHVITYCYPVTGKPGQDINDVLATKEAERLGIPVIVISPSKLGARHRHVEMGWVVGHDDASGAFLIDLTGPLSKPVVPPVSAPFEMETEEPLPQGEAPRRKSQQAFRRNLVAYSGATKCVLCGLEVPEMLDAAHLRDLRMEEGKRGSDDPRNGLMLCANHHRAFDAGLVGIDPGRLRIVAAGGVDLCAIGVTVTELDPTAALPHPEALAWAWGIFKRKSEARRQVTVDLQAESPL